tara:strand:- start:534 stop:647 length:114 start_codon:yes stop_codon:yes gene_type:complete
MCFFAEFWQEFMDNPPILIKAAEAADPDINFLRSIII